MRILSLVALFLVVLVALAAWIQDSPHGNDFKVKCELCHSPKGWELDREIYSFEHNTTKFPLEGQHTSVNCKLCHPTLVFSEAGTDCYTCHTDMHEQTVGMDCARCHSPRSWIVENITDVHRLSRFPLQGPHFTASCQDCHPSASLLRFEPLGVECIDCHMQEYQSAANPNHVLGGFSTQCMDCHYMTTFTWGGSGYTHSFFPLTQGHALTNCNSCHTEPDYSSTSPECFSCHQEDYNAATNPNHGAAGLSTDCLECHTTAPGWKPAVFTVHDALFFPIYSGEHRNEWSSCTDCHSNPSNYSVFSCIDCHEHNRADMDDKHSDENDYEYNSIACLDCHPRGSHE